LSKRIAVIPHIHKDALSDERINNRAEISIPCEQKSFPHGAIETVRQHVDSQLNIDFLLLPFLADGYNSTANVKPAQRLHVG